MLILAVNGFAVNGLAVNGALHPLYSVKKEKILYTQYSVRKCLTPLYWESVVSGSLCFPRSTSWVQTTGKNCGPGMGAEKATATRIRIHPSSQEHREVECPFPMGCSSDDER